MNGTHEHPSLSMRVTPDQRERAEQWLQEAYADGRISEDEFDRRIGDVIGSVTRRDLNSAFYGLVHVPATFGPTSPYAGSTAYGAYGNVPAPVGPEGSARAAAAIAHFSVFFSWLIGPGLVFLLSPRGSYPRKEAAKAFNFQVIAFVLLGLTAIAEGITNADVFDPIRGVMAVSFLVLTIIGGVKAAKGEDWRNPVKKVLKVEVLPER